MLDSSGRPGNSRALPNMFQGRQEPYVTGALGQTWQVGRAKDKYRSATLGRSPQILIPGDVNAHAYRLQERMEWGRSITDRLPPPRNALEAQYRIQSPMGSPFPFNLPRWANYWHFFETHRDANGRPRGGRKAQYVDLCKLLWMEGFSQSNFPSAY